MGAHGQLPEFKVSVFRVVFKFSSHLGEKGFQLYLKEFTHLAKSDPAIYYRNVHLDFRIKIAFDMPGQNQM